MLVEIIKYTSLITLAGAAISFMVGLWKYLDQRKREDKTKRYELFHNLMGRVSAKGDGSDPLPITQQIAAIYELQNFSEYKFASIPVLEQLKEHFEKNEGSPFLLKAIDASIKKLSGKTA